MFTFDYTAPGKAAAGTVSVTVPAGFSAPQDISPAGPGYLSASSACAHFQVTGIAPGAGGGVTVTLAVNCAAKRAGAVTYRDVTAPTAAGGYPFATAFTPAGSQAPVLFAAQHQVTVKAGPLAQVVLSPATATIAPGGTQSYTAQGLDAYGNSRGDVTAATKFKISPNGSCTAASCTATATGPHTVTGTHAKVTGTATLSVGPPAQADLSAVEAVSNATPFFGTSVTFTTTVTNNGPATAAGVTVTVAAPPGLVSPAVNAGAGSYANGTWTIGSLASGTNATLTITGLAGDVSAGTQTVTAAVTATTPDPNPANNTAAASEASQPAPVGLTITPDPSNPSPIDIDAPGTVTWTVSVYNAANPAAPGPAGTLTWTCSTASQVVLCPPAAALTTPNSPSITFTDNTFNIDTYTLTVTFSWTDPNYQSSGAVDASVEFTTVSSG